MMGVERAGQRRDISAADVSGKVVEVKLSDGDGDIGDAQFRNIAYGSVSLFALLQSRRNLLVRDGDIDDA
ncbi:hypothetical protein CMV_000673 [Castanea mollissima]|uniref:Uncharacterized protein n=1 Tax=Castanea mollissima TaxID=60419 RepID=A0A8J4RZ21_9ROSI|nr:hypothetical protein CMV_000673 [Castanea mollissima]